MGEDKRGVVMTDLGLKLLLSVGAICGTLISTGMHIESRFKDLEYGQKEVLAAIEQVVAQESWARTNIEELTQRIEHLEKR